MTPIRIKEILSTVLKSPIIKNRFPMINNIYIIDVREKHLSPDNYVIEIQLFYDKDKGFDFDTKEELRDKIYDIIDTLNIGGRFTRVYINDQESQ